MAQEYTNLYNLYETDPKLEKEGIGLKFGTATFYVRRAGGANTAFDTYMEDVTRNMTNRLQLAALTEEQSSEQLMKAYAETVILGWDGVRNRQGEHMEFTKENFTTLMRDLPTLWRAIRTEAASHENFRRAQAKQEGEAVGN